MNLQNLLLNHHLSFPLSRSTILRNIQRYLLLVATPSALHSPLGGVPAHVFFPPIPILTLSFGVASYMPTTGRWGSLGTTGGTVIISISGGYLFFLAAT